ncbi:(d)CMP kinase [Flavobacteriales bacterium]|nr:(d)CMP kinase [Flavobacteriales bacterium]
MKKINIAIDGHSSCGKSTIAKQLANHFGYVYIDTGAMYRSVCLYCLQNDILINGALNTEKLIDSLDHIDISFSYNFELKKAETLLNNVNVENEIRSLWVSENVSKISKVKEVRAKLIKVQKKIGEQKGVVMDGRDIGSVVFPDAELKLFITASLKERTLRRFSDLKNVSMEEIERNLDQRDYDDSNREENPLVQSKDAILIDNTNLSKKEQLELILGYCNKVILG